MRRNSGNFEGGGIFFFWADSRIFFSKTQGLTQGFGNSELEKVVKKRPKKPELTSTQHRRH